MMRFAVLASTALLAACNPGGPTELEYRVLSHSGEIVSASLMLCDQAREMSREGSVWTVRAPASCEGGGVILVQLADGATVSCSGDYVTPDMRSTTFGYVASSTGCAFAP